MEQAIVSRDAVKTGQEEERPEVTIHNIVFTCHVERPQSMLDETVFHDADGQPIGKTCLNLKNVVRGLMSMGGIAGYNPKRFAAVVVRFKPKIAVLIFSTGKIVCTGSKNRIEAVVVIKEVIENIKKMPYGYPDLHISNYNIENVVSRAVFSAPIDCRSLSVALAKYCSYEPDNFPGVIFRPPQIHPACVLIFTSGRMILTGAKSESGAKNLFAQIFGIIIPFVDYSSRTGQSTTNIARTMQINERAREIETPRKIPKPDPPANVPRIVRQIPVVSNESIVNKVHAVPKVPVTPAPTQFHLSGASDIRYFEQVVKSGTLSDKIRQTKSAAPSQSTSTFSVQKRVHEEKRPELVLCSKCKRNECLSTDENAKDAPTCCICACSELCELCKSTKAMTVDCF